MARPLPQDLDDALAANPPARDRFAALPQEKMAEWVHWVERARLPRRRRSRVAETIRTFTPVAETTVNGGPPVPPPRDTWAVWLLALALLAALAALIIWFLFFRDDGASKTSVPRLVGQPRAVAETTLRGDKLEWTETHSASAKPKGVVVAQAPKGGEVVKEGSTIALVISNGPPSAKLPDVTGLPAADAAKRLEDEANLPSKVHAVAASAGKAGIVAAEHPSPGTLVKPGTTIVLDVPKPKPAVAVPAVTGQDQQAAVATLKKAGLAPHVVEVPSSQPKGTVLAQKPAAGAKSARGTAVRLNVSKGAAAQPTTTSTTTTATTSPTPTATTTTTTTAPAQGAGNDYRGMKLDSAVQKIAQGRQQTIVVYVTSSRPAGIVVANGKAGARERLQVSAGPTLPPAATVSDERGQDAATAQSDLESAGFTVITVDWPVSDPANDGVVVYQTPAGKAPNGAAIVLYVGSLQ